MDFQSFEAKGKFGATTRIDEGLVQEALKSGDQQGASKILFQVLDRLSSAEPYPELDNLFVSVTLELATLCFVLGQNFNEVFKYLCMALVAAQRLGNRRSEALIKLHIGRIYYLGQRRKDAIKVFEEGKKIVDELGDEDIHMRAGEFLGLYYQMQGLFREAMAHYQHAVESFEIHLDNRLINPSAAMWMSYCEAYLGQFPQAFGRLDYYRRIATEHGNHGLATTLRAVLVIILLMIRKLRDASFHGPIALDQAIKSGNVLAHYFALGACGEIQLYEGRPQKAREMWAESLAIAEQAGIIRQYASPNVLEMLYKFHRLGLEPIPQFTFHGEAKRVLSEPNLHLRGVALRLRAMDKSLTGVDLSGIEKDLETSADYLIQCGDPIQLGKTWLELSRLRLRQNDLSQARAMARKAWENFYGYGDVFYPDDLRHLLESNAHLLFTTSRDEFPNRFMEILEELLPTYDTSHLISRFITATNKFFGAERGGLFWFGKKNRREAPVLRAACNLTQQETLSGTFRTNFTYIFKSYRENTPVVTRLADSGQDGVKALLCFPLELDGEIRGVLYHDNSYIEDCFDFLSGDKLQTISSYLSNFITRVWRIKRKLEETTASESGSIIHVESSDAPRIVSQSKIMESVLSQADRIAKFDSTVLLLGETGVGKELMAQRIHRMSTRQDTPLVVVDMTTIPDTLVESELFGHEKGSFTGADRQKKGRLEMAHKGTLFIDELGEISKNIQVKLLRAIQEKTFVRVGGTRPITADFRLIAATNRDLSHEVKLGNFREDLYYRLSTFPIIIPPLRERAEDIVLLARHFLKRFSAKYGCLEYELSDENEAMLRNYSWPGNIRELINIMERAVILSTGQKMELNIPGENRETSISLTADTPTLDELQRRYIQHIIEKAGGKISGPGSAAEILGMRRTSLYSRMKKLGLR